MKLERTRLVATTLLPNTNPQRSNQTTSKINPLAPDTKNTSGMARLKRMGHSLRK